MEADSICYNLLRERLSYFLYIFMSASLYELGAASLLGFGTTSSSIVGAALGLYFRPAQRILACVLAFAAGALISALAIELGYQGAICVPTSCFFRARAYSLNCDA